MKKQILACVLVMTMFISTITANASAQIVYPSTVSETTTVEQSGESLVYGDFKYETKEDGTVKIVLYTGSENVIKIPSEIDEKSVTEIGDSAFLSCITLMSIEIPDSVTTLGWYVFNGCTSLGEVTIGKNVTAIGGGAFRNCESLKNIVLPDSITVIDSWTFENCKGLQSITISDNVTSIEP